MLFCAGWSYTTHDIGGCKAIPCTHRHFRAEPARDSTNPPSESRSRHQGVSPSGDAALVHHQLIKQLNNKFAPSSFIVPSSDARSSVLVPFQMQTPRICQGFCLAENHKHGTLWRIIMRSERQRQTTTTTTTAATATCQPYLSAENEHIII